MQKEKHYFEGNVGYDNGLGLFIGEFPIVEAAETFESIIVDNSPVKFVDENGEVIAVFTPYSETNPAPDSLTKSVLMDVNVNLNAYTQGYLSNKYNFNVGDQIGLNIRISPNAQSSVGLYDRNTNSFSYPVDSGSATGWNGTLTVGKAGLYSLAFINESAVTANYSGTYTLP